MAMATASIPSHSIENRMEFFTELAELCNSKLTVNDDTQGEYKASGETPPISLHFAPSGREYKYDRGKKEWEIWQ